MKKEPIGKILNILSRGIKTNINHNLLKYNITMEQARFLMFLERYEEREIYQKDLCTSFHSTKGSVSTLLNNLENATLIERIIGSDARHKQVKITNNGSNLLVLVKKELDLMDNKLVKDFNEEEKDLLYTFINRMLINININEVYHD